MKNIIAVYAGTFDPVTNGHLDIVQRASEIFSTLYVTILENPNKKAMFDLAQRKAFLEEACRDFENVIIADSPLLAVEYARQVGARVLVRGLRATMDFEAELQMAFANQYLDEGIEMAFLMTKANHAFISSSTLKEIAIHRPVYDLAPACVARALEERLKKR